MSPGKHRIQEELQREIPEKRDDVSQRSPGEKKKRRSILMHEEVRSENTNFY